MFFFFRFVSCLRKKQKNFEETLLCLACGSMQHFANSAYLEHIFQFSIRIVFCILCLLRFRANYFVHIEQRWHFRHTIGNGMKKILNMSFSVFHLLKLSFLQRTKLFALVPRYVQPIQNQAKLFS